MGDVKLLSSRDESRALGEMCPAYPEKYQVKIGEMHCTECHLSTNGQCVVVEVAIFLKQEQESVQKYVNPSNRDCD